MIEQENGGLKIRYASIGAEAANLKLRGFLTNQQLETQYAMWEAWIAETNKRAAEVGVVPAYQVAFNGKLTAPSATISLDPCTD
jgi:hypothetical protein